LVIPTSSRSDPATASQVFGRSVGGAVPQGVAIVQGHPDPDRGHLCHGLADAYADGAAAAGHTVMRIEPALIDFPMLRSQRDFEAGQLPSMLTPARDAIVSARHLVIIFPLWHGTMPALLKAFLEQVMRPGIAMEYRRQGIPRGLLEGRSARIVVTMGMPGFVYRWYFRAHGVRGLERSILRFAGMKPVRETLFGEADDARRQRWLDRMKSYGARSI
jgi:putative NADPH-quinone reductase